MGPANDQLDYAVLDRLQLVGHLTLADPGGDGDDDLEVERHPLVVRAGQGVRRGGIGGGDDEQRRQRAREVRLGGGFQNAVDGLESGAQHRDDGGQGQHQAAPNPKWRASAPIV